jgi:hypothetical protein
MLRLVFVIVSLLCCFGCSTSRSVVNADGKTHIELRSEDSASLVRMLAVPDDDVPQNVREEGAPYSICEILLERRQTEFLVNAYQKSSDEQVRFKKRANEERSR